MRPETRYARSGNVGIAYQVVGGGDLDLVVAFPFLSHLDLIWESPPLAAFLRRLASFARVIVFDRRGVGLSDPVGGAPTLEERMDDVRAVMDAAGSERAALLGMSEGATMCMLFAATYPERTAALVLWARWPARPPPRTIRGCWRGRRWRRPTRSSSRRCGARGRRSRSSRRAWPPIPRLGADKGAPPPRRPRRQRPRLPLARRADRGQPLRRAGGRGPLPLGRRQQR